MNVAYYIVDRLNIVDRLQILLNIVNPLHDIFIDVLVLHWMQNNMCWTHRNKGVLARTFLDLPH
jgi:hypothetical protein